MSASSLIVDARHAVRQLARTPGFTLVAVLTFAIGVGVNTAVFTVVNAVLLSPLPYPASDRIAMVWLDNTRQGIREDVTSYPGYRDWRDGSEVFSHLAAFSPRAYTLTGAGEPERIEGAAVTASLFDVVGIAPILGRTFTAAAETPGEDGLVVISHGLWQRHYGASPAALGETIILNGRPHEVIGVMPPAMRIPEAAELWTPLAPSEPQREARGALWLAVIGRLAPDATMAQAQGEMSRISAAIAVEDPRQQGFGANVVPLHEQVVGDVRQALLVLMAAVGFVLLIACANLANLLFGRTAARRRELAVRTALGASRLRILRQIVVEAIVLAVPGTAAGVLLAGWATTAALAASDGAIPRAGDVAVDGRVLAFAVLTGTVAAALAGLLPAWQASRTASTEALREGTRQGAGTSSHRTRAGLVAAEVALAFVLLMGAGLLAQTLWRMQAVDRGFTTAGVATMRVSTPPSTYPEADDVRTLQARLLEAVRATPGVEAAAVTTGVVQPLLPLSTVFSIDGRPLPPPEERLEYPFEVVSPGFFETLEIPLVAGRAIDERDHADAPRAVVINESAARHAWPGQDPLGRRMQFGDPDPEAPEYVVVGVMADIQRTGGLRAVRPEVYLSALQLPQRTMTVLARTSSDPASVVPVVRERLRALDPSLPLYDVATLDERFGATLARPRFQATLLAVFAVVALVLAAVGIYGVTAHAVEQRTQEVGIRMALGAARVDVLRMMVGQALVPIAAGLAVGVAGALALNRFLAGLLYGVEATDPATFAGNALVLAAVALLACWIPARRATTVDPLTAVRAD